MFKLDEQYLKNLKAFIGKEIRIYSLENGIEFYHDIELQYRLIELSLNHYELQIIERGKIAWKTSYDNKSETEMKRELALILRGYFGAGMPDFGLAREKFKSIENKNLTKLDELMSMYVGNDFYSINNPQEWKINFDLSQTGEYDIYFLCKNGTKIERGKVGPISIFSKFCLEARYLKESLERINQYQKFFSEHLQDDEIEYLLYRKDIKNRN